MYPVYKNNNAAVIQPVNDGWIPFLLSLIRSMHICLPVLFSNKKLYINNLSGTQNSLYISIACLSLFIIAFSFNDQSDNYTSYTGELSDSLPICGDCYINKLPDQAINYHGKFYISPTCICYNSPINNLTAVSMQQAEQLCAYPIVDNTIKIRTAGLISSTVLNNTIYITRNLTSASYLNLDNTLLILPGVSGLAGLNHSDITIINNSDLIDISTRLTADKLSLYIASKTQFPGCAE